MHLIAFCQSNGGHSGQPGKTSRTINLLDIPKTPENPSPNAGKVSGFTLNIQNPSDEVSAGLVLGKKYKIEITEITD